MSTQTVSPEVLAKAKRRIKRFLETGVPQARVEMTNMMRNTPTMRVFLLYRLQHHGGCLRFKVDKLGRLTQLPS